MTSSVFTVTHEYPIENFPSHGISLLGQVKHLSSQRKRNQDEIPLVVANESGVGLFKTELQSWHHCHLHCDSKIETFFLFFKANCDETQTLEGVSPVSCDDKKNERVRRDT